MQLLVIFGPPAVGKMTVGRAIAVRSGFRLFHNHASMEPVLEVFDYGTPPFRRVLESFRRQVVEEAAASGTDLVLTFMWGLDLDAEVEEMQRQIQPYVDAGATISFVELAADLDTRLARNRTELRLTEKRSKRDLEWSEANLLAMEEQFVMNTPAQRGEKELPGQALLARHRHLRLDNSALSPEEAAGKILTWLGCAE